jgi:hypothetical protein
MAIISLDSDSRRFHKLAKFESRFEGGRAGAADESGLALAAAAFGDIRCEGCP